MFTQSHEDVSSELRDQLLGIGVCTATHALVDLGFNNRYAMGVHPMAFPDGVERVVGRAFTLRFIPLREDLVEAEYLDLNNSPHRTALESIQRGDILVIDAGGSLTAGVVGDIFTRRIQARGGHGIIIDGALRDLQQIRTVGIPVFSKGIHGAGIPRALMSVGFNEPIQCGGVAVLPGDIVLADRDGVVFIPPHTVSKIVEGCQAHEEYEMWVRRRMSEGVQLHTHYPPNADAMREFEAWKASQK